MNDLIYRQHAINALENTDCELSNDAWDELTNAIKQVPSAEPKKGRWVKKEKETFVGQWWWYECSECAWEAPAPTCNWEYKYCPDCGAKMEVTE